ncbi:DUF6323 family protein [Bacilliculturomica massiliensis]|uniref:DUF6323 family protein n=1 Tax=Bacilliculturomica massiliensis TaxID=1917867 RepID=UPI001FE61CC6|nr:DUF6323 family protein [Bacilliculturomica massiliensis]
MEYTFEMMIKEQRRQSLQRILSCNEKTAPYGLTLSEAEASALLVCREQSLAQNQRIEFGESILPQLIEAFCDSPYINCWEYSDVLARLQDIFYLYKNESLDQLSDDELLDFMSCEFNGVCCGDLDYLESTCLERFARAIRSGYEIRAHRDQRDEYTMGRSGSDAEYRAFDEETRWEFDLFRMKLDELD